MSNQEQEVTLEMVIRSLFMLKSHQMKLFLEQTFTELNAGMSALEMTLLPKRS